jgi:CheY-like chemotaxis protein
MLKQIHSKPTIFLVDDDPEDRELLLSAFRQITDEHHLTALHNSKTLLELLAHTDDSELPCLIVLDSNMPELDGKQTLKLLQSDPRYREIPKVIYSTSSLQSDRVECISLGARDYLVKPNSVGEILRSARKMLNHCDTYTARFV